MRYDCIVDGIESAEVECAHEWSPCSFTVVCEDVCVFGDDKSIECSCDEHCDECRPSFLGCETELSDEGGEHIERGERREE